MVWFDAFRADLGPTWYGDNKTAVVTDIRTLGVFFVFAALFGGFVLVFPGLRRQRVASFLSVTASLTVGAILLAAIYYPAWQVGSLTVATTYRSFAKEKLYGAIGVSIGLTQLNITLQGHANASTNAHHHHLDYNERFEFTEVKSMKVELAKGLRKGLPYPMLSVIEYLSVDRAGFVWGREFRLAGYYTCILLWMAFGLWLLGLLLLGLAPELFSRATLCLGATVLTGDLVYALSSPDKLAIPFRSEASTTQLLTFSFGWCFYATTAAGAVAFLAGLAIRLAESRQLYTFATFLHPRARHSCGSSTAKALVSASSLSSFAQTPPPTRPLPFPPQLPAQASARTSHWLRYQCLDPANLPSPNEPGSPASQSPPPPDLGLEEAAKPSGLYRARFVPAFVAPPPPLPYSTQVHNPVYR